MVIENDVKVKGNDKISNVNHSEWSKFRIKDICELINGRGFKPHEWEKKGLPIIRIQNLNGSKEFNYYTGTYNEKILVKNNELLFAWSGSRGTSFGPYLWKFNDGLLNYHTWRIKVNERLVTKDFLFHSLKILTKHIEESAHGASALVHVQKSEMENFEIMIPEIEEQKAIATALSDMDDLILSLEKLISKKKLIKEGAMEELITGKKRLVGFNEKWENKKLNEVCWFQEGPGLRNWQFTNRGMKVINVTNLEFGYLNLSKTDRHISLEEFNRMYKHFEIDEHDIVVASSGNSYGKVAVVRKQDLPLVMNTSVIRFKVMNKLDYNFLLQFLKSKLFISQIDLLITGGAQPNFGPAHLNKIEIKLPKGIEEQMVIGKMLSDMDNEIKKLEKKLDKYKNIKSGMMEELLTGKRRLV